MDEGASKDLKSRLTILEDESGLELSLGLSCGGGGPSSSSSSDKKKVSDSAAATTINSEDARAFWLEAAKRKSVGTGSGAVSQGQWTAQKARTCLGESLKDEQLAAAWSQLSKQAGGGALDPSKLGGFQAVGMNLAKYLSAKARSQQQQQQNNGAELIQDEDQELEQQKRFYQQQEARKKRKLAIDEKKRDENGQEDTPGVGIGHHQLQRAPSIGTFPAAAPSMAAFMRRTISEPVMLKDDINSTNSKDKVGTSAGVGATTENSNDPAAEAGQHNGGEETSNLASWQLGTTKDIPPAENINPELSTARPGSVPVGGTGSSADLPWVSTTANGKTINGVMYKMNKGQYKVVCACHGLHMSPTEFVKHAGHLEPVKEPLTVL